MGLLSYGNLKFGDVRSACRTFIVNIQNTQSQKLLQYERTMFLTYTRAKGMIGSHVTVSIFVKIMWFNYYAEEAFLERDVDT
jgi:hypothetical protein